ncbi:hypothetical protein TNCV_3383761 [Trichonephila clavipes]|uniref:Uncharacterized protein n=1 Tax=Trichonephila clavipes TaxID=2585209 RepID=A0A8X6T3M3_TRICX|nr:hypothetical protein TNCV_3383761 [Trichonephila clavipes]
MALSGSLPQINLGVQVVNIMLDPSPFVNPMSLARADTSRDVLPRGGTSQSNHRFTGSVGLASSPHV